MLISPIGLLEPIQNQDQDIIPGYSGNPYRFIHTKCPLSPMLVGVVRSVDVRRLSMSVSARTLRLVPDEDFMTIPLVNEQSEL